MSNKEFKPLVIEGVHGKIATLERRHDHLVRRLERGEYANSTSADWDRAEVAALRSAIQALQHHAKVAS